jgi:hypothetical protein
MSRHIVPVAVTLLVGLMGASAHVSASCVYACNLTTCTNCGSGWECDEGCAQSSCTGFGEYCSCTGYCSNSHVKTTCKCLAITSISGQPGSLQLILTGWVNWGFHKGDNGDFSLSEFGAMLEATSGWGVALAGDTGVTVAGGTWAGTFQSVVESIGSSNGFAVSFDSTTHLITLTGL